MKIRIAVLCSAGMVALMVMTGCTGYRLGSTFPPDIKTVAVPSFVNKTSEPLLEASTTSAAIREIQNDGLLRVVSEPEADAILRVTLVDYELGSLRFSRDNADKTAEYRVILTADMVFVRANGDELIRKRVKGDATFDSAGDLTAGKRIALPDAAADLAHDIVEQIVEYW